MRKQFQNIIPLILIASAANWSQSVDAGIISILKHGKAGEEETSVQKVAFVGCAEVREVRGEAEQLCGLEKWQPIKAGEHLSEGAVIRTESGMVVLEMCESRSLVKVTPQTVLRLVPLKKDWDRGSLSGTEEKSGCLVRTLSGKASYRDPTSGDWKRVAVNSVIPAGSEVKVEKNGTLFLFDISQKHSLCVREGSSRRIGAGPIVAENTVKELSVTAPR